jgi:tetratricopeptide (TPR) repeat protein
MEATINWSYQLLSETERVLLRRLSVFSGGWTLEAAKAVASDQTLIPIERIFDLLSQLVNKSLILVNWDSKSEVRFNLLQTVNEFAREKLLEAGELEFLCERHFQYFCSVALQREQELFRGKRTIDWAEAEINNLRAVFSWALSFEIGSTTSEEYTGKAMELMSHVHLLWLARGFFSEGKQWLKKLLAAHPKETLFRARALILACVFAANDGDHDKQLAFARQSLAISRKLDSKKHLAWALCWLGWTEGYRNNHSKSIQYLTESLELLQELEENLWVSYAIFFLAESYLAISNLEVSRSLWIQGIEFCHKKDFEWQVPWGMEGLATLEQLQGNYEQARKHYLDSVNIRVHLKDISGIASSLESLAELEAVQNQFERAAKLWGAAHGLRQRLNHFGSMFTKPDNLVSAARTQLGEACYHSSLAEGRGMSIEQAIEFALGKASIP